MPSLKVIDNSKISTPESFANAPESGGSDECNVSKEAANHSQSATNSSGNNNGNAKEQPASPLQQIVLIIEHKIRNLEKRKVSSSSKRHGNFLSPSCLLSDCRASSTKLWWSSRIIRIRIWVWLFSKSHLQCSRICYFSEILGKKSTFTHGLP